MRSKRTKWGVLHVDRLGLVRAIRPCMAKHLAALIALQTALTYTAHTMTKGKKK